MKSSQMLFVTFDALWLAAWLPGASDLSDKLYLWLGGVRRGGLPD